MKGKNSQGIGRLKFGEGRPLMLKIIYPNCCSIDVHKTFVVAVISITDRQELTTYHRKRFSTFTNGLVQLRDWLEYYSCFDVCIESTSKYWIPVFNILEKSCNICLTHPKYVKAIRGKKTNKHVLLKQESYNPRLQGLTEIRNPDKTMSVQDTIHFAQRHGFKVL